MSMTGKEIRIAIRDRIGTSLAKRGCEGAIQLLGLYDEFYPPEGDERYREAYEAAAETFDCPLDFLSGMALERILFAIDCCKEA